MIPLRNRIAAAICITIFHLSENQAMDLLRTPVLAIFLCPRGATWHPRNWGSAADPSFLKASAQTLGSSFTRCETASDTPQSSREDDALMKTQPFTIHCPFFHIIIHIIPQVSHQDFPFPSKEPVVEAEGPQVQNA